MMLVASRRRSALSLRSFIFSCTWATLRRYQSGCRRSCGLMWGMAVAIHRKRIRPSWLTSVVMLSAAIPESVRMNSLRFAIEPPSGQDLFQKRSILAYRVSRGWPADLILGGVALQRCIGRHCLAPASAIDTFCPLGPWIVTADEIPNPQNLAM